MHAGQIQALHIKIEQLIADPQAIQRQHGLELMLSNSTLAFHMGTQEDLLKPIGKGEFLICMLCALDNPIVSLLELCATIE